jgi:hypothetical protein
MVYIQSNAERTLPHHFDCAAAMYGATDNGHDCRLTSIEEVVSGKFDRLVRSSLFVGSTAFMEEVFRRSGSGTPGVPRNSNRVSEVLTLARARERASSGDKIFVKPLAVKQFTGFVLDDMVYPFLDDLDPETLVRVYDPFPSRIMSEWRVYVHRHDIIDSRNYAGDFTLSPDYSYVRSVVEDNRSEFPVAYTLDVGVLEGGVNVVVEFNDMWAIGNYGIPNDLYHRLLRDRYFEIVSR